MKSKHFLRKKKFKSYGITVECYEELMAFLTQSALKIISASLIEKC